MVISYLTAACVFQVYLQLTYGRTWLHVSAWAVPMSNGEEPTSCVDMIACPHDGNSPHHSHRNLSRAVGDPGAYQRAGTGPFPVKTGRESNAVGPDGAFLEGLAMRKAACENG